jgi:hypothetical protein
MMNNELRIFKKRIENGLESVFHRYDYAFIATSFKAFGRTLDKGTTVDPRLFAALHGSSQRARFEFAFNLRCI